MRYWYKKERARNTIAADSGQIRAAVIQIPTNQWRRPHAGDLDLKYKFIYRAPLDKNLIEHELDYVFIGIFDGTPAPNPAEVEDWKFVRLSDLKQDIEANPNKYTPWFRLIVAHEELNSFV